MRRERRGVSDGEASGQQRSMRSGAPRCVRSAALAGRRWWGRGGDCRARFRRRVWHTHPTPAPKSRFTMSRALPCGTRNPRMSCPRRLRNRLTLAHAVMLQFGGADRPFSQPPHTLLNPRAVVRVVPCGFEAAHSVRRAGRGTAPVSSGFVQNALHSHHAQDAFPAFSYRSRGSTAASWPGRTPRSPSVHSEARRPLASKGPPDGLRAAHGFWWSYCTCWVLCHYGGW